MVLPCHERSSLSGPTWRSGWRSGARLFFGREDAVPYNLEEGLRKRGAGSGKAWMAFSSHVVEDGKLITGQNPASAAAVGEAVVKRLKEA